MKIEINLNNKEEIIKIANKSTSITNLIENLGWSYNKNRLKIIKNYLLEHQFDLKIFKINEKKKYKCPFNNCEKLQKIINESYTYSEVLRKYNKKVGSGNYELLKKYIKEFEISTKHFDNRKDFVLLNYGGRKATEEMLIENGIHGNNVVKKRILKEGLLEYKCHNELCNNNGIWFGHKMALHLDHINGINNDYRIEKLRFLCPNCHAITKTWGNKKRL